MSTNIGSLTYIIIVCTNIVWTMYTYTVYLNIPAVYTNTVGTKYTYTDTLGCTNIV